MATNMYKNLEIFNLMDLKNFLNNIYTLLNAHQYLYMNTQDPKDNQHQMNFRKLKAHKELLNPY